MKRTVLYCTVLHLAEWAAFLLCDYREEHSGHNDLAITVGLFVLPVISAAVLFLLYRFLRGKTSFRKNWMYSAAIAGVWFLLCGIAFLAECILIDRDVFPIRQQTGGWEHFLNGIEYIFFPAFNLIIGCGMMLLLTLILALNDHFRSKKIQES